jgi:hypothetical protein
MLHVVCCVLAPVDRAPSGSCTLWRSAPRHRKRTRAPT